jgi:peptidylprolyl isomerase
MGLAAALLLLAPANGFGQTAAEVLTQAPAAAWRGLDLEQTLIMELADGREVVIELAPAFAPRTIANIQTLTREGYFNGLSINRVQDNYVVQWGDPDGADQALRRSLGEAREAISPQEYWRPRRGLAFTPLPDGDVYAPEAGFSGGFPAARNRREAWLAHCYGMVGVGRDTPPDSGSGAQLYVVIGHSPRHLDRNITLVGRAVFGIEALAALPRGTGPLGFYQTPEERTTIASVRLASEAPDSIAQRLEVLRTDAPTFTAFVEARRNRRDAWFFEPAGRIDVCNAQPPVRLRPNP